MPVTHGHKTICVQAISGQLLPQSAGLLLGKTADRRSSTDRRIVVLHLFGASGGDQFGQRFSSDAGKGKINKVGIAKKIKKEGVNRSRRIRAAELEQNYTYSPCWVSHPPGVLEEGGCYSKSVRRVNVEFAAAPTISERAEPVLCLRSRCSSSLRLPPAVLNKSFWCEPSSR